MTVKSDNYDSNVHSVSGRWYALVSELQHKESSGYNGARKD